jgi:hypothetical protein
MRIQKSDFLHNKTIFHTLLQIPTISQTKLKVKQVYDTSQSVIIALKKFNFPKIKTNNPNNI